MLRTFCRKYKFIFLGIFVHILYLKSMLDVYFTSPLVTDLLPIYPASESPAKRLVLFIADGLRADKFFEVSADYPESRAPYLRSIIQTQGAWGISHTRVPTETRPGHVAIIAGFYEDVAAVTKGWKVNPVDFDSIFNESRKTFAWGSLEVLQIFTSAGNTDHVILDSYDQKMIDFADKDGSRLDMWVYNKVEEFFTKAKNNATLNRLLRKNRIVLFLHLLGLDTNGHGHRPYSKEYLNNIRSMDSGVKRMEDLIESFFENDKKTSFIMTSDHGMSDWGSHGTGHPDETLTPFVAWGAGIRGPTALKGNTISTDDISKEWNLSHLKKSDVNQADTCPLMAALIGAPIPLNSVGILPVDYLNTSNLFKAESLFRNARQILAQYDKKQQNTRGSAIFFRPFSLTDAVRLEYLQGIRNKISNGEHDESMELSRELIQSSLAGLRYYHLHNTAHIAVMVTFGYIGWIFSLVLEVLKNYTDLGLHSSTLQSRFTGIAIPRDRYLRAFFVMIAVSLVICLITKSSSIMEYLYGAMPLVIWYQLLMEHKVVKKLFALIKNELSVSKSILFVIIYGSLLGLLVCSFTHRGILSFILINLGLFPLISKRTASLPSIFWLIVCVLLSVFPMLPTIVREGNYALVAMAGLLTAASSLTYIFFAPVNTKENAVIFGLVGAVTLSTFLRLHTVKSIHMKLGLPLFNQVLSWSLGFSLPALALLADKRSIARLVAVFVGLVSIYILTCVSHEGLFIFFLALAMFSWISCEQQLLSSQAKSTYGNARGQIIADGPTFTAQRPLTFGDVRISFTFIYFILLGFFGTGNIASLNSFDPAAVNCFITVFNPILMAVLLSLKILTPFLLVACAFSAMQSLLDINIRGIFYIVLIMTDIMSIIFFFLVKDEGSWQDIGTSISHFVIMLAFIIFLVPLFELACLLTGSVMLKTNKSHLN